jgi:uncharacterized RDD family membrane protein YckC
MQYAGFWRRFFAYILDGIILLIFGLLTWAFLTSIVASLITTETGEISDAGGYFIVIMLVIVYTVVPWIYCALMETSPQQATLGKQATGIIVTDRNGKRITFGRATGRFFAKFYLSTTIVGFGFLMAAFTEKNQALHDIIAGTYVLKR